MPIPTPTIPSSETSVSAVQLRPTQSGNQFYINSGLIGANNTETTVISLDSVGSKDILICVNPILSTASGDDMTMKVKNNGAIIFQSLYSAESASNAFMQTINPIHFIIPANTSLEVTFTNSDSSTHNVGVSAYGYYL